MILIGKIENKIIVILISFTLILIIGFIDYITGSEVSFLLFYLFPISLVALYKDTSKTTIIFNTLFASVIWLIAEFYSRKYSNNFNLTWNAFVRFSVFLIIGLLANNLKAKYKKLVQINNDLQILNEDKNRFIGIAAHDLRNPIGTIYSFSDILLSDYPIKTDAEVNEIICYIKELSNDTLNLLKNLLDIS